MLRVSPEVAGRFTARDEDNDREATFYRMSKQEPGRPCLYLINTINDMAGEGPRSRLEVVPGETPAEVAARFFGLIY